mmetsp:Transcript_40105/g.62628  ORF Transcript_40105/g.62628 Transcript_40105/m.62628 type:complete len:255 (-) Transcript_40105:1155-1919(-)
MVLCPQGTKIVSIARSKHILHRKKSTFTPTFSSSSSSLCPPSSAASADLLESAVSLVSSSPAALSPSSALVSADSSAAPSSSPEFRFLVLAAGGSDSFFLPPIGNRSASLTSGGKYPLTSPLSSSSTATPLSSPCEFALPSPPSKFSSPPPRCEGRQQQISKQMSQHSLQFDMLIVISCAFTPQMQQQKTKIKAEPSEVTAKMPICSIGQLSMPPGHFLSPPQPRHTWRLNDQSYRRQYPGGQLGMEQTPPHDS